MLVIIDGLIGYVSILITLTVTVIGFVIFMENRHPTQTLTWLVVLAGFPILGFIFYLLFGRNYRKERMFRKKYFLDKQTFLQYEAQDPVSEEKLNQASHSYQKLFYLAQRLGNSPISFGTDTKVLTNGEETFAYILQELQKAVHHIHLEYYIVRDDEIGQKIKSVLIQKAREGVKIRFLYDAVGSWKLSKEYIDELKAAGIEMVLFGPVRLPFLNSKFNFRNHRKIIVIDGSTGFVGGLNIGDEYLGQKREFRFLAGYSFNAKRGGGPFPAIDISAGLVLYDQFKLFNCRVFVSGSKGKSLWRGSINCRRSR